MISKSIQRIFAKKHLDLIDQGHNQMTVYRLLSLSKGTVFRWIRLRKEKGRLKSQVRENKPKKIHYEQLQAHLVPALIELAQPVKMHRSGIGSAMVSCILLKKRLSFTQKPIQKKEKY